MLRSKKNKQNENNNSVELGSTDAPELLSARDDDDAFTRDNASSAGNEYSDLQLRTQSSASGTYDFGDGSRWGLQVYSTVVLIVCVRVSLQEPETTEKRKHRSKDALPTIDRTHRRMFVVFMRSFSFDLSLFFCRFDSGVYCAE